MMNSKEEDIYNWIKEYFPGLLKTDYDIDKLSDLYEHGKDLLGKFKTGDYLLYEWSYPYSDVIYTSVAVFDKNKREEHTGNVSTVHESDSFIFTAFISDTDIYNIDNDTDSIGIGYNFVYSDDIRLASDSEKEIFLNKIKKHFKKYV